MLAVFRKTFARRPTELVSPDPGLQQRCAKSREKILRHFQAAHPAVSFCTTFAGGATLASIGPHAPRPSFLHRRFPKREILTSYDNVYCVFVGSIQNLTSLVRQYGLSSKPADEALLVIELYRTLRDRGSYQAWFVGTVASRSSIFLKRRHRSRLSSLFGFPCVLNVPAVPFRRSGRYNAGERRPKAAHVIYRNFGTLWGVPVPERPFQPFHVRSDEPCYQADKALKDIAGSFAFVVYDNTTGAVFAALSSDCGVPLYWGVAADGLLVIGDEVEIVKGGCGELHVPQRGRPEEIRASDGQDEADEQRVDSEGTICGASFNVDVSNKVKSMPRVGSAANWASTWRPDGSCRYINGDPTNMVKGIKLWNKKTV
ncbi:hypothetical protein ZIOFF_034497 [Zingiber officinale]|uniref:DUF3700 domain-containing protein n=1 Tax=Zingiber officinale TaxID=94328 RepID=A0A8J5LCW6_ZINOF|nr:hypothetical protein ZIOFF_034497 [Zingiber officinale]